MRSRLTLLLVLLSLALPSILHAGEEHPKPLFKNFMGLNGHTVTFKPELYAPVCRLARDYHPVEWDLGTETDKPTTFPMARNRVPWDGVYGKWLKHGFDINCSLMFESIPQNKWKDLERDAKAYGVAFAKYFGPSGKQFVNSAEIGNEPGKWDDASYRKLFTAMAKGMREADPKLLIATCNLTVGKSHEYAKSVTCVEGLNDLFDIVNTHVYAMVEGWPTWRRSYPEDPKISFLKEVQDIINWRDEKAKGKPVWVTEFGWDSTTKPNHKSGNWAKWVGCSDTEQAQWLVRSFLVFSKMSVERAYIYFHDDKDEPSFHAASGLTRNSQPKPSYHAVGHLYKTLGDYRFSRVVDEKVGERCVYEFTHGTDAKKKILAVWSPTGSQKKSETTVALDKLTLIRAEQMPLSANANTALDVKAESGSVKVPLQESPVYLLVEAQ